MTDKNRSQYVWANYILVVSLIAASFAFAYVAWWSFLQTRDWFAFLDFDGNGVVGVAMAVIFQYGQGPVLYMKSLMSRQLLKVQKELKGRPNDSELLHEKSNLQMWIVALVFTFIVFAGVDAWSNRAQLHEGLDAKVLAGIVVTPDKYFFTTIVAIVTVFIEEALGITLSLTSNLVNDLRQIHGMSRIKWLDVFGDFAKDTSGTSFGAKKPPVSTTHYAGTRPNREASFNNRPIGYQQPALHRDNNRRPDPSYLSDGFTDND